MYVFNEHIQLRKKTDVHMKILKEISQNLLSKNFF